MSGRKLVLGLLASTALMTGAAYAQGEMRGELSANVALTTDYVFRGVSQSDSNFAISGGFDYTIDKFYVGTWASSIDFGTAGGPSAEIDLYAGVTPSIGQFEFDLGVIGYFYPDAPDDGAELDYWELYAGVGTKLGIVDVGAQIAYSPEWTASDDSATYLMVSAGIPLGQRFAVDAHLGYQDYEDNALEDTVDWSIGVTTSYMGLDFDLRYHDTDLDGAFKNDNNDARVVFTVSKAL